MNMDTNKNPKEIAAKVNYQFDTVNKADTF
jgi:hypothetical protein